MTNKKNAASPMPYLILRKIPAIKICYNEFIITNLFIQCLDLECFDNFIIHKDFIPISCGEKYVCYSDIYHMLKYIPQEYQTFRPLKHEKHANIIIDMFERLDIIDMDSVEIMEVNIDGKKKYSGYMQRNGKMIKNSYVKQAPTIPILKCSIVANMLFDKYDYAIFRENLSEYFKRGIR